MNIRVIRYSGLTALVFLLLTLQFVSVSQSTIPENPEVCSSNQEDYTVEVDDVTFYDNCDDFDTSLNIAQNIDQDLWTELNDVISCPCEEQAIIDNIEAFDDDDSGLLWAEGDYNWFYLDYFHPGADEDYRSIPTVESSGFTMGQQCTYADGTLITDGAGAGTPDLFSPNMNSTLLHRQIDVAPFEILGWGIYSRYWTPNNGNDCAKNAVTPVTLTTDEGIQGSLVEDPTLPIIRLPDAIIGREYEVSITVNNPSLIMDIELTGGTVPPGFDTPDEYEVIDSDFTITGTPDESAENTVYTFTITVDEGLDIFGESGSQTFEILVRSGVDIIEDPDPDDGEVVAITESTGDPLDLIFVIDTTGSMDDDIGEVRRNAIAIINRVAASGSNWRIGIVTYQDHPGFGGDSTDYPSLINLDFSSDQSDIVNAINSITLGSGGDPEESVYSGLMTALGFGWRDGAKKAIILMGDAPPHDPEAITGYTMDDVLELAFNIDPVNIYPLLISNYAPTRNAFQQLADGSSGRLFFAETAAQVVDSISTTIGSINYQPILSEILDPGDQARVFVLGGGSLNVRQGAGLSFTAVTRIRIGDIVTIIGGPIYSDTYLWWNIETPSGTTGWAVESLNGIATFAPLSYEGISTYEPPEDRSFPPADALILSGGRGLTNGAIMSLGEFQVEWYCNNQGYGVGENTVDWYCTGGGSPAFNLQIADFDAICQATYNYASAFAVQDGNNGAPAYNWRCYGPR